MEHPKIGKAINPFNNSSNCGDLIGYWSREESVTLCIIDGLGHGIFAKEAARAALDYVGGHVNLPLNKIFSGCNEYIRQTWGVAMGIAVVTYNPSVLTYAGIGNTRIKIIRKVEQGNSYLRSFLLTGNYGIVGTGYKNIFSETISMEPGDLVIMYTDGVKETIDISGYDKLLFADLQMLAEKIIKDWSHNTDDAAVLTYRFEVPV